MAGRVEIQNVAIAGDGFDAGQEIREPRNGRTDDATPARRGKQTLNSGALSRRSKDLSMAWHAISGAQLLFYGADILVLARHFSAERCVMTFSSRMELRDLPSAPFGSGLLVEGRCSHVCFIAMSNHWWQTPEFKPALERVSRYLGEQKYERTVAYGVSMGGVGSFHASAILHPDEALVFAGQYDISPDVVPWDSRWHDDANRLKISLKKGNDAASTKTQFVYVYDSFNIDKKHIQTFPEYLKILPLPLPLSGHETFTMLKEGGQAGAVARLLLLDPAPPEEKIREARDIYRKCRRGSQTYWRNLAQLAGRRRRPKLKEYALGKAQALAPDTLTTLHALGLHFLVEKDDPVCAESQYDRAIEIDPDHPAAWRGKARCRQKLKDYVGMVEFALAALARGPDVPDLNRVLIEAAAHASDSRMLRLAMRRYIRIAPDAARESFVKRFAPDDFWTPSPEDEAAQMALDATLELIRNRRPRRYSQLFQCLMAAQPRSILEIGVFSGATAEQMIQAASFGAKAAREIEYVGFDLFEDLTPEVHVMEFSKAPPSLAEVAARLARTSDNCQLIKGYSRDTLPAFRSARQTTEQPIDFVFIVGGHSEETIEADWRNVEPLMSDRTIVVFDDYYIGKSAALAGVGCNLQVGRLQSDPAFQVEILPIRDRFQKDFGELIIACVKVRRAGAEKDRKAAGGDSGPVEAALGA